MNVYQKDPFSDTKTNLFSQSGDRGDIWHPAFIDILTVQEYQLQIEVVDGYNYTSDIAIDDTMLSAGPCSGEVMGQCLSL